MLVAALEANDEARAVFDGLPPSRQKEIVRYIASLKNDESVERNVARAISFFARQGTLRGPRRSLNSRGGYAHQRSRARWSSPVTSAT